jgi:uncharacterized membrane protein
MNKRDDIRTTYATAARGYDQQFRDKLIEEIVSTIAGNIVAIRVGETADALAFCLISVMAMSEQYDNRARLRTAAIELAKKIRRDVARARADPTFAADFIGARRGGSA